MARQGVDTSYSLRNASIVTIIIRQPDQGTDSSGDETIKDENINHIEAATEDQAAAGVIEPELCKFIVHENLVCEASPVLKAAFQGHFAEAESRTITTKGLDADMVNQFLKWLYRGKILPVKPDTPEAEQLWYFDMARLFLVADMWQIDGLEDDVIDKLVKCVDPALKPPGWPVIKFVYANTCKLSHLRRWVVAWYTEFVDPKLYKEWKARRHLEATPDFAVDIAMAYGKQSMQPKPKSLFDMTKEEREASVDLESESEAE